MMRRAALLLILILNFAAVTFAQDFEEQKAHNWHQWRGPFATGEAGPANPPTRWSETQNIGWKVAIPGEGSSTPIIWNHQLFLINAIETNQKAKQIEQHPEAKTSPTGKVFDFYAICLDKNTGKEIWKKKLLSTAPHEGRHPSTTYAAASPHTDGESLYVSFGSFGIFCLSLDGELKWEVDLGDMRTRRGWGEAVSPAVAGDKVIVMWDQEDDSKIYALNKADGSIAWEKDRDEPTTWATPLIIDDKGTKVVVTSGTNAIRAYHLESGEIQWQTEGLTLNAIPCPVIHGKNIILMSGYRGNKAVSLNLEQTSNSGTPSENWSLLRDTPYVPSPLLTNNRLYFTKSLNAILSCVDVDSGKPVYDMTRLPGLDRLYASPVATQTHIYIASREGATLVIENSPEFKVVARNELDNGIDASPAIVGDQIFIRTKTHLYCIENK